MYVTPRTTYVLIVYHEMVRKIIKNYANNSLAMWIALDKALHKIQLN